MACLFHSSFTMGYRAGSDNLESNSRNWANLRDAHGPQEGCALKLWFVLLSIDDVRITCRTCCKSKRQAPRPRGSDCMGQPVILSKNGPGDSEADT